jgi:hypothetical protein
MARPVLRVLARVRDALPRTWGDWCRFAAALVAWGIILGMIGFVVAPAFKDMQSLGSHDWDQMEAHRLLVRRSIREFRQFPFWNPFGCGGSPSWAGMESGSTVVSPWLPFVLYASLPVAVKAEMAGTAVIAAVGTWLLAGRFTRSAALKVICCAAFVVNGRWALQIAVGHTWHLYYAWTPWTLYFFDRAVQKGRQTSRDVVLCGACIAMMVYGGGIYPLPQTIVALGVWAIGLAALHRSIKPLGAALCAGLFSFGLSAPKLIPTIDMMLRFPRTIASTETIDLHAFVVTLTARDQSIMAGPAMVTPYGWHEWGCYIGWVIFLALFVGAVFARAPREVPLKWVGLLLVLLSFGAFHDDAPWTLLHKMPIFSSQHVPSRWVYPGILVLAVVFSSMAERWLRASRRARPFIELGLLGCAAWIAWDVANVATIPIAQGFVARMPKPKGEIHAFHAEPAPPVDEYYDPMAYGPPSLLATLENVDPIECMLFPGLGVFSKDEHGVVPGLGAKGRGDPKYRGEAFTASGKGVARLASFSPNEMTVEVHDAVPGDRVVLNQNWDDGWRVGGSTAVDEHDLAAATIRAPNETFVFRYRPRLWWLSMAVFLATAGIITTGYVRRRRATHLIPGPGPGSSG